MSKRLLALSYIAVLSCVPFMAQAHEVYVLGRSVIQHDTAEVSPNPFLAIVADPAKFALWAGQFIVIVLLAILIGRWSWLQRHVNPGLDRLKPYAPVVGRVTLGGSLLASAFYGGLFGPELPLTDLAGVHAGWLQLALYILGTLILIGWWTRLASALAVLFYAWAWIHFGSYLVTYLNYFGEMILMLILGGQMLALDILKRKNKKVSLGFERLEKYSFLILRICFGLAVLFAALYAKFWYSNLALQTVNDYHLTQFFPFSPLFLVLGSLITEVLLALCFLFGFLVRFAAVVFTIFLTLSILYFGEAVWPHLILFGVNIVLFLHGYDRYTLGRRLLAKGSQDSVL